jgi:hypothetical protein
VAVGSFLVLVGGVYAACKWYLRSDPGDSDEDGEDAAPQVKSLIFIRVTAKMQNRK